MHAIASAKSCWGLLLSMIFLLGMSYFSPIAPGLLVMNGSAPLVVSMCEASASIEGLQTLLAEGLGLVEVPLLERFADRIQTKTLHLSECPAGVLSDSFHGMPV